MNKIKKYMFPTILIFIFMASNGFSENMKGLFIPIFKNEFGVNNSEIGVFLMISSLGFIAFQYIGGIAMERFESRAMYIVSLIGFIISFIGMYFSPNFLALSMFTFLFSACVSFYDIITNSLIPVMFIGYQAIFMNLTHFCYGFGETIGQRVTGIMLQRGMGWRELYLGIGVLYVIMLILFFFAKVPSLNVETKKNPISFRKVIKNKLVILYIIAMGLYIFSEVSVSSWFANFLETSYKYNKDKSSYYIALFFGIFTVGRLFGGFVVEKVGHFKSLMITLPVASILFFIGLLGGEKLLMMISISGLFFSIVYATCVVTITNVFKENTSYILGTIMTFASTVNMILGLLMGYLNDTIGVYRSFFAVPLSLILSLVMIVIIYRKTKNLDYKNVVNS